jgi:nuclear GTP-binding protein
LNADIKTAEEKLARIEAAKAARKAAAEEEEDVPGILNLRSNKVIDRHANLAEAGPSSPLASPPPELVDNALPTLQAAIDRADVLLEVVDARDPMGCRSAWLEGLVASADGQVVIALTNIGTVQHAWTTMVADQ